ncbi:MAG: hypothetical protein OEZ01_04660 [Candidatus Heimdallarchaeota archaeon]|nr:hypothetical protein [Candidatus Heimdallarchaeota archaeon]
MSVLEFYDNRDNLKELEYKLDLAKELKLFLVNKMISNDFYKDYLLEGRGVVSTRYIGLAVLQEKLDQLHDLISELEESISDKEYLELEKRSEVNRSVGIISDNLNYSFGVL